MPQDTAQGAQRDGLGRLTISWDDLIRHMYLFIYQASNSQQECLTVISLR